MVRTLTFILMFLSSTSIAQQKGPSDPFGQWHTTHGIDKFPCMNSSEMEYFTRLINVSKIEEKKKILADHRKQVAPSSRAPASIAPTVISKANYVCPPFRGVRNPHPQVFDFGKASTFERIRLTQNKMQILNGLNANEQWPLQYNTSKGYYEGQTPRGTPTNLIPIISGGGSDVRFIVQYMIWKDNTAPALTLCYREDLHKQCNPYAKPGTQPTIEKKMDDKSIASPSESTVKKVGG